jgi:hypothetical protein
LIFELAGRQFASIVSTAAAGQTVGFPLCVTQVKPAVHPFLTSSISRYPILDELVRIIHHPEKIQRRNYEGPEGEEDHENAQPHPVPLLVLRPSGSCGIR